MIEDLIKKIQMELKINSFCRQYNLSIEHRDKYVVVSGFVSCFHHKQVINEVIKRILVNGFHLKNEVVVQ